ncbi:MAG: methylmalonyl Co-A mutase-associated GTPase MeaB [Alphaproteobacteria bacterium]|nr:methylmalonyl Co-A mutase-associated GTPase MeaB [Alphaproteobacteria bacterium]
MRPDLSLDDYVDGVLSGDRALLARAITLVESRHRDHRVMAQDMLMRLLPKASQAHRVGITGVPGVGKSTFIDALGTNLTRAGHRVAVLAVDPTSSRTGGSILGDKTRMARLAKDENAFIRPSPASGTLGGVTRTTRETMLLCEAAGFDIILVETVGVGQSEIAVSEMVDFFLVLVIAGAGDELQGIKRGILEIADMIAVNKADGDNRDRATRAESDYANAMYIMTPSSANWTPPVVTCSALENQGLDALWETVLDHRERMTASGEFSEKRRRQSLRWMWTMVEDRIMRALRDDPAVAQAIGALEAEVAAGKITPTIAADQIVAAFKSKS